MFTCKKCGSRLLDSAMICPSCETDCHVNAMEDGNINGLAAPWLLFALATCVMLYAWSQTPMSSGVPATFGNFVQTIVFFLVATATLVSGVILSLGTIARHTRRNEDANGIKTILVVVTATLLVLNIAQLAFALFGPDI